LEKLLNSGKSDKDRRHVQSESGHLIGIAFTEIMRRVETLWKNRRELLSLNLQH